MAKIYSQVLRQQVADGYSAKVLKAAAQDRIEAIFDDAVFGMKAEFEEHPVTQEIAEGVGASNISKTLSGGEAPRNLFAFIGFPDGGGDPTDAIRQRLDPDSKDGPDFSFVGKDAANPLIYKFKVDSPNLEKIYKETPMPWGPGLSWAKKIETSIPGLGKFLSKFNASSASRSGGGIQVKKDLNSETYTPPVDGYLTTIFKNFINRVKESGKGGLRYRK